MHYKLEWYQLLWSDYELELPSRICGHLNARLRGFFKKRLQHTPARHPKYSPDEYIPIKYGQKGTRQYAYSPDSSPFLSKKETKYIQSVAGTFLYYGRAMYDSILPALNEIASC